MYILTTGNCWHFIIVEQWWIWHLTICWVNNQS